MRTEYETLRCEVLAHVCTLTIDRPERRNALNPTAYAELESAFREIQKDADVRCVILTGTDPAFCSGEDVKEMMTGTPNPDSMRRLASVRPAPTPAAAAVLDCDRPIIAAVNGAAVGWGMDLSLFADFRIASERARFGELFVKRGLVTDLGGLWRLPKIIGPQRAAELVFTGDIIDARTAHAYGLVMDVVAHEALLDAAGDLAARIAANPPLAVRYLKEGFRRSTWGEYGDLGSWISSTLGVLFQTEDHREGVASFLEKRPPVFKGR
ncbi:MAG TPA: enoyl-CoA hydratase-related protein [Pseudomonadales bacterium]|nr:enoyl-CoA hydratase-related protein [Pseudomonadales bacterium]